LGPVQLLHWHYLIFLVPLCVSAFLLLASSLRLGHHRGGHGGHGHAQVHGGVGGAHAPPAVAPGHGAVGAHGHAAHGSARHAGGKPHGRGAEHTNILFAVLGIGKAPLAMVLQAFFLVWGLAGCLAAQQMLKGVADPTVIQVLPVMGVAAVSGALGGRLVAELIARLMPEEETAAVSRSALYGLKGSVAFPVTESGGRIMVYDDYGSLHDESCRVAPGHPPIERGRKAIVVDCDARGCLLVEETPD